MTWITRFGFEIIFSQLIMFTKHKTFKLYSRGGFPFSSMYSILCLFKKALLHLASEKLSLGQIHTVPTPDAEDPLICGNQKQFYCSHQRYKNLENPHSHLLPTYLNKSKAPVSGPEI